MARLTESDRQRLRSAVQAAESRTRAEFVMVVARRADPYFFPPAALTTAVAIALPGLLWVAGIANDFAVLYGVQLAVFAVLLPLLRLPALLPYLIPPAVGVARARRLARDLFHRLGLHRTQERVGVLLFVSLAEHYVEIIADDGANDAVAVDAWRELIQSTTERVRRDGAADGLAAALERLAEILGRALPRRPDDKNEIPDRLIEL
jgi:putative membrane protein